MKAPKIQPIKARIKRPEIVESSTHLARQLGPKARFPRTRELSKALGVTLATLDQGLRQLEGRGLIERRPRSGIFVSPHILQRAVGMVLGCDIFSTRDTSFYSILLDLCIKRAAAQQERFSFFLDLPNLHSSGAASHTHQDLVDALSAGKLDGLLVAAPLGTVQQQWLRSQGVPVVCLDFGGSPGSVTVDIDALVQMAAKELKKRGCRSLALMSPVPMHAEYFRRVAQDLGFKIQESWIFSDYGNDSHEVRGRYFATELLNLANAPRSRKLPDGLIITDDIVARGACPVLASHGVAIGKDIKIASHCNKGSLALAEWEEVLIRCQVDPGEVAGAMFAMLQALMDGNELVREVVSVPPRLLINS